MDSRTQGNRVIQIPLEWPARCGTVLEINAATSPAAVLIAWDDGRQDWIEDEDFRPLRIWFISDDEQGVELKPGALGIQLSRFMDGDPARTIASPFPKGHS